MSYVPLLMFAIRFGLSMDYEVFLLSQIQEHYEEGGEFFREREQAVAAATGAPADGLSGARARPQSAG